MLRRRGGRGVLSTVAQTAVIAGTASAVSGKVAAGQQQQAAARQQAHAAAVAAEQEKAAAAAAVQQDLTQVKGQLAALQAQQVDAAAHPGAGAGAGGSDLIAQLQQLAQLREANMLTDEEFSAAKAKLLAS